MVTAENRRFVQMTLGINTWLIRDTETGITLDCTIHSERDANLIERALNLADLIGKAGRS